MNAIRRCYLAPWIHMMYEYGHRYYACRDLRWAAPRTDNTAAKTDMHFDGIATEYNSMNNDPVKS